jgi:pyruvate dehydrogenase kinase 2/3/4
VGQVFLKCNARKVLESCGDLAQDLAKQAYGPDSKVPEIELEGDLDATFPYILSHLEYIIGELLRNSVEAVVQNSRGSFISPPPIKVLVCEAPQHVIFRISDQGGGIPRDILPYIWSFSKGPRRQSRLENLNKVSKLAATMQELSFVDLPSLQLESPSTLNRSLSSLTSRPPDLKLGIGLPMGRIYAEYWAGSLEVHSLEGYGTDHFLHISKLGNKNEQLSIRASMDKL